MTTAFDLFSAAEAGMRLRSARESAGLTQAAAAALAGIARTTLVAIEQGQRKVRLDELLALAKAYGTSVNGLFRQEAISVDFAPRFRRLPATREADEVEAASSLLTSLAKAEAELEALLRLRRVRNYPPRRPILPGDVKVQAEQDAQDVRQWLGLGLAPVTDVPGLLETQVGVRLFSRGLASGISGLYAYDAAVGACMLINARHPRSRRNLTAAHAFGHLVCSREEPEILIGDAPEHARDERYANAFAHNFLMPARLVMQRFQQVTAGSMHLTRRHVILLGFSFGVSREAIVRRLEALKLAKPGTWDWFESNNGITDDQVRQVLGGDAFELMYGRAAEPPLSQHLHALVAEAWKRELLSEGQLARLLQVDRVTLRRILDAVDTEWTEADEALALHA